MVFGRLFPKKYWPDGRPMTADEESAHWVVSCNECGCETNIKALGGVRYRAQGTRKRRFRCEPCGESRMMTVRWRPPE